MTLRDPAETHAISVTEEEAPLLARTGHTEIKSAEEEETREALLLVVDGGVLAVPPSVQHSKHQKGGRKRPRRY